MARAGEGARARVKVRLSAASAARFWTFTVKSSPGKRNGGRPYRAFLPRLETTLWIIPVYESVCKREAAQGSRFGEKF